MFFKAANRHSFKQTTDSQSQGQADLNVQPKQLGRNNMDSFNDHTKQHGTGEEFSNTKVKKKKTLNQNGGYIFVA